MLETGRDGQLRLAVPGVGRRPYATGIQTPCARCAAAGVTRLGMPYRVAGDATPLCMPCWRGESQRRDRVERLALREQLWEGIGAAETAVTCPACDSAEPSSACWLCGWAWVQQMRALFDADQAAAAAVAERNRQRELDDRAAAAAAEERIADLSGWAERLNVTLTAYAEGRSRGRAVELLAELLSRVAASRSSERGRPSAIPLVGAVLAVDSDWRSGRRALPGRARAAELAGCSERAVSSAYKALPGLGWAIRTVVGGRLSLQRRRELGRGNERAEFDLIPLHRCDPSVRAPYLATAVALLEQLLGRAMSLLEQAQATLDELRGRLGDVTDWTERARRAQLRQAVARAQARRPAAVTPVTSENICTPHTVSQGDSPSSASQWGLSPHSTNLMINRMHFSRPTSGRTDKRASRSPKEAVHHVQNVQNRRSQRLRQPRKVPAWAVWAYPLARDLAQIWPWLSKRPRPQVAAVLGTRLGPDWTAPDIVRFVTQRDRPVLEQPAAPLGYLRSLLEEALCGSRTPPCWARRHAEYRRNVAKAEAHWARERQQATRAQAERAQAARDAATSGPGLHAVHAVMADIAARQHTHREDDCRPSLNDCDWPPVAQPGGVAPDC